MIKSLLIDLYFDIDREYLLVEETQWEKNLISTIINSTTAEFL